jgi:hypothetical protein
MWKTVLEYLDWYDLEIRLVLIAVVVANICITILK